MIKTSIDNLVPLLSFRTLHRDLAILSFLLAAKLELTSNTEPYDPVPSVFPVGTTWSKKYCCNLESLLKVLDQPRLLAIVSSSLKPCYRATPERSHCIRRYPRHYWPNYYLTAVPRAAVFFSAGSNPY